MATMMFKVWFNNGYNDAELMVKDGFMMVEYFAMMVDSA